MVRGMISAQPDMQNEQLHATYRNLCDSVAAFTDIFETADDSVELLYDCFMTCLCCHHFVTRRIGRSNFMFPLQILKLHLLCLPVLKGKTFDARVAQRLAAALSASTGPSNFFRSAFTPAELELCERLANANLSVVTSTVATFVFDQNARSPFLPCAKLTELVRGSKQ